MAVISLPNVGSQNKEEVSLYTLTSKRISVTISTMGATILSVMTPDRNGQLSENVLGYEDLCSYERGDTYFGATIGRYADRITNGRFELDGMVFQLDKNDPAGHSLHGGSRGFDKRNWKIEKIVEEPNPSILLSLYSPNGEMGYPGNLHATVCYTVDSCGNVTIDYTAVVDKKCPVSFTNHTYFNLSDSETILDHKVKLNCNEYLSIDGDLLLTGDVLSVLSTPFDLTVLKPIGTQIHAIGGFDHAFIIDRKISGLVECARVEEPTSGRTLKVATTLPVLFFYTGSGLNAYSGGKVGAAQQQYGGFCIEPQLYPNSMNIETFPSSILHPHETYAHTIVYSFGLNL